MIHKALDFGITLFDTADIYGNRGGSETVIGEVLGARRKDIVLATKFGMQMDDDGRLKGASRRYIMSAVEASLKRLKTDWIDLYQYHKADPLTPIEETLRALDDLVRQGKVRYIGCSNMPAWQVVKSQEISKARGLASFISCQDEYSLVVRNVVEPRARRGDGALRARPAAVLPARERPAHRQVRAQQRCRRMARTVAGAAVGRQVSERRQLDEGRETRSLRQGARPYACSNSPSAGSRASHPSRASSPAPPRRAQVEANVKAAGWQLTAEEMADIDKISLG